MRKEKNKYFTNLNDAWIAYDSGIIKIHSYIHVKFQGQIIETTMGRIIFNRAVQDIFESHGINDDPYINEVIGKKKLSSLIYDWYMKHGNDVVSSLADQLKDLGF